MANKNIDYSTKVLEVKNLKQYFKLGSGLNAVTLKAVDDVSFDVYKREVFGLVGESGCGKTTTGRSIIKLYNPTDGTVIFNGVRIGAGFRSHSRNIRKARRSTAEKIALLEPVKTERLKSRKAFITLIREKRFENKGIKAKKKTDLKFASLPIINYAEALYQENRRHMLANDEIKYQKYVDMLAAKKSDYKTLKKEMRIQKKANKERARASWVFYKATTKDNFILNFHKRVETRTKIWQNLWKENAALKEKYTPLIENALTREISKEEKARLLEKAKSDFLKAKEEERALHFENLKKIVKTRETKEKVHHERCEIRKNACKQITKNYKQMFGAFFTLIKNCYKARKLYKNAPIDGTFKEKINSCKEMLKRTENHEKRAINASLIALYKEQNKIIKEKKKTLKLELSKTIKAEREAIIEAKLDNKVRGPEHQINEKFAKEFARLDAEILNYYKQLNNFGKGQTEYNRLLDSIKHLKLEVNKKKKQQLKEIKAMRREVNPVKIMSKMQMIFQDPIASLNPRMVVREIIAEGLKIQGIRDKKEIDRRVFESLELVGLVPEHAGRYPHEFSGGQRQRIGIARALVVNPDFIIADEPISALDVSIQAQVINLLNELKEKLDLTILFIAHDLSVVKYFSDRIAVMYFGKIMELATSEDLFKNPLHPYTKSLLSAIPQPDPLSEKKRTRTIYNPNIHNYAKDDLPTLKEITPGHFIYCDEKEFGEYKKVLK